MSYTEADTRSEVDASSRRAEDRAGMGAEDRAVTTPRGPIPADAPTSVKLADVIDRHATALNADDLAVVNAAVVDLQAYEGTLYDPILTNPPVNVDVPVVTQDVDVLSCTMGNWDGEPTSYTYQWNLNGMDIGPDSAVETYTVTVADIGASATCVVTAYNDQGLTKAPPSVALVVADPGTGQQATREA